MYWDYVCTKCGRATPGHEKCRWCGEPVPDRRCCNSCQHGKAGDGEIICKDGTTHDLQDFCQKYLTVYKIVKGETA